MRDHQVIAYPGSRVIATDVSRDAADRIANAYSIKHPEGQVHVKQVSAAPAGLPSSAPRVAAATSERTSSDCNPNERQPARAMSSSPSLASTGSPFSDPKAAPSADLAQPFIDETYGTADDLIAERYQ